MLSHASIDRLVDSAAGLSPILEGTEIIDQIVAHVFEYLAAERRASARGTIEDDCLVLDEILVVVGRLGIGTEFQHAARDVYGAGDLTALFHLRRIAHIDHQGVALSDHLPRLRRRDTRHRGVGGFHHLLDAYGHVVLSCLYGLLMYS